MQPTKRPWRRNVFVLNRRAVAPESLAADRPATKGVPAEDVVPCPTCGSVLHWVSSFGVRHCQQCEPIGRALELAATARRLRHQADGNA